jgi:hypothetical protein
LIKPFHYEAAFYSKNFPLSSLAFSKRPDETIERLFPENLIRPPVADTFSCKEKKKYDA